MVLTYSAEFEDFVANGAKLVIEGLINTYGNGSLKENRLSEDRIPSFRSYL